MKKFLEVFHPNTAMRTFWTTVNIDGVDSYVSLHSPACEAPPSCVDMVRSLWAVPAVKGISLSRGEIRIEVSEAWEDEWEHVSPAVLDIIDGALFGGEATRAVRDDAAEYARRERDRADEYWPD